MVLVLSQSAGQLKLPATRLVDELKSCRYGECARPVEFPEGNPIEAPYSPALAGQGIFET